MTPQRVSSNATLGLKIFVPTVWVVFFGFFTLAFLFAGEEASTLIRQWSFRAIWILGFLLMFFLIWKTLWQLRRVEIDDAFVYITDYFKTARYPFHNIEKLRVETYGFMPLGFIVFKVPGLFGKKCVFIAKQEQLLQLLTKLPELQEKLVTKPED